MNQDAPKLHGWITPEYAEQMVWDLLEFLKKNSKNGSIYDLAMRGIACRKYKHIENGYDLLKNEYYTKEID